MSKPVPNDALGGMTTPDAGTGAIGQVPPTRLGGLALTLMVIGLVVTVYVVHAQMPANAVTLPLEPTLRRQVVQVLPEGWAFFTRNPREDDPVPFARDEHGQWSTALRAPHSEPRNVFGFDRSSRAQGVEMGLLAGPLHDSDWQPCQGEVAHCLEVAPAVPVVNPAGLPTLCGDVGLVRRQPVPWAWSRSADDLTTPSTVVRMEVSC